MVDKVMFSSNTDEWATPRELFDRLNKAFGFTLDPAASHENALCTYHFTQEDDGLSKSWAGETVWCNPPYSSLKAWLKKGSEEGRHTTVVMLVPARTDTKAWHEYVIPWASEIHYVKGRLKFGDAKNSAPFPSAIIVFRPLVRHILT